MGNKNKNIAVACLVLIVAAGAFFAGTIYQKNQKPGSTQVSDSSTTGFNRGGGQGFTPGSGSSFRGGGTSGTIASISGSTITVTATDGSTKTITLGDSTTITKSQTMAESDLAAGQTVTVMGTTNSDGSVTARNITIR